MNQKKQQWKIEDIIKSLIPLQTAYRQALDDDQFDTYIKALMDIPPDILAAAIIKLIRTQKFFPAIAEIRQAAQVVADVVYGQPQPDWSLAFLELKRQIRQHGHNGHPAFSDPFLAETVKRMGWFELCTDSTSNIEAQRAQFRQIYNSVVQNCHERQESKKAVQQLLKSGASSTLCEKLQKLNKKMLLD
ncbi:MAG: hypothetical protein SOU02_08260 [Caecibacter massiliensis]|nr:hypothetical protein [Caecibacter massiliensis]